MISCAVVNCPNHQNNTENNVTYHPFPTNTVIRKRWLSKCGQGLLIDCSRFRVCSNHFAEEDFEYLSNSFQDESCLKRCLKESAEPHLNLIKIKEEPPVISECNEQVTSCLQIGGINNVSRQLDSASDGPNLDALTQLGALSATIQVPPTSPSSPPLEELINHHAPSSLPASETWPGQFNFKVFFGPQDKNTKGVAWTYSEIKDKLYVGKDAPCPINFSTDVAMPDDVVIRAMALYNSPEQVSEIVHRCVNHSMDEIKRGVFEAEHLIRCESSMASYHRDNTTKRHSVVVPFENPPVGQSFSTYIYKFACFGSCAGGPNRRPIMVVFTLEKGDQVIGRRKLDLKICACPGRDRKAEEQPHLDENENKIIKRKESHKFVNLTDTLDRITRNVFYPPSKKAKLFPDKNGHYVITTEDEECYEFLKQMKKFYEICQVMKNLHPEVKKSLFNMQKKSEGNE